MIFKKCISLFLSVFILVSTNVGMAIHVHYCGGKLASVSSSYLESASNSQKKSNACCGIVTEKKGNCCQDKVVVIKKKQEQTLVKSSSFEFEKGMFYPSFECLFFLQKGNFKTSLVNSYFCDANAPPLFKLFQHYIFYA